MNNNTTTNKQKDKNIIPQKNQIKTERKQICWVNAQQAKSEAHGDKMDLCSEQFMDKMSVQKEIKTMGKNNEKSVKRFI